MKSPGRGVGLSRRLSVVLTLGFIAAALAIYLLFSGGSGSGFPAPAHLTRGQLLGTWETPTGGTVSLSADGSFRATKVCGFGTPLSGVGSDGGTWSAPAGEWVSLSPKEKTGGVGLAGSDSRYTLVEGTAAKGFVRWSTNDAPDARESTCELHKVSQ